MKFVKLALKVPLRIYSRITTPPSDVWWVNAIYLAGLAILAAIIFAALLSIN